MPKFMLIYKGEPTEASETSDESAEAEMQRWMEWAGAVGEHLLEFGAPFGGRASVVDDGSDGTPATLSGYSIVEAADLDGAKAHVKGHPYLIDGNGDFAVDVYELIDLPTG